MSTICVILVLLTLLATFKAIDHGNHTSLTYWLALDVIYLLVNTL